MRELFGALGSANLASAGLLTAGVRSNSPAALLAAASTAAVRPAKAAPTPAVAALSEAAVALRLQLPPSPGKPGSASPPGKVTISLTATSGRNAASAAPPAPAVRAPGNSQPVTALSSFAGLPEPHVGLPSTPATSRTTLLLSPPCPHFQQKPQQRGTSAGAPAPSSCTGGGARGAPPALGATAGGSRAVAGSSQHQQLPHESSSEYEDDSYWLNNDGSGEGACLGANRWAGWLSGRWAASRES